MHMNNSLNLNIYIYTYEEQYLVCKTTVKKLSSNMKFPRYHTTSTNTRLFISCVNPKPTLAKDEIMKSFQELLAPLGLKKSGPQFKL